MDIQLLQTEQLRKACTVKDVLNVLGLESFARNADEQDLSLDMLKTLNAGDLLDFGFNKEDAIKIFSALQSLKYKKPKVQFSEKKPEVFHIPLNDGPNLLEQIKKMPKISRKNSYKGHDATILLAASLNDVRLINMRLTKDPYELEKNNRSGWTPLMFACQQGHIEACRFLLSYKANVYACDKKKKTSLMLACSWGHALVARELLSYLLEKTNSKQEVAKYINMHDIDGFTALHFAVKANQIKCIQVLRFHNANPYLENNVGVSAIKLAEILNRSDALIELTQFQKTEPLDYRVMGGKLCSKSV